MQHRKTFDPSGFIYWTDEARVSTRVVNPRSVLLNGDFRGVGIPISPLVKRLLNVEVP